MVPLENVRVALKKPIVGHQGIFIALQLRQKLCFFPIRGEVIGIEVNCLIVGGQRFVISPQTGKDLRFLPVVVVTVGVEHNGLLDGF